MTLGYKFRLYPDKEQERKMSETLEVCRNLYNRFLKLYKDGEHDHGKLQAMLPVWKGSEENLRGVHSKVLQYVLWHLFCNLKKQKVIEESGRKVGKLRPKPPQRFRSFTYNQTGIKLHPGDGKWGTLHLSKIGDIPIRLHREVKGKIKGVTIKHMPSGEWDAIFWVDDGKGEDKITFIEKAVSIDLGLVYYAVDSDGLETENPRHLKKEDKKLRRDQRRLSRKKKGSKNWEKQRIIVARDHEHIKNQRNDFQHKLSRYYVDNYDAIFTENLNVKEMIEDGHLAQSIYDAGWGTFNQYLA